MSAGYGSNTDRILLTLGECGPLTQAQLVHRLEIRNETVAAALHRLRHASPQCPKRIYICRWVTHSLPGKKAHLRPVFDLGLLPDAPKPAATSHRMCTQRRQRMMASRHAWAGVVSAQSPHELRAS